MAWTEASDQSFTHAGTNRDVFVGSGTLGTLGTLFLRVADKSSSVKGVLFSDQSGENCWEAGIEGANAVVRKAVNGTPAAASASSPHSIGASTPFAMRVDAEGTIIKVFINGVLPAAVTYDIADDELNTQGGYGFTSSVNNAVVLQAFRAPLIPNVLPAIKVLVWVANGDIWYATRDPATGIARAALAQSRAMGATVQISTTESLQKLYLADGLGKHKVFDAATLSVSDWEREGVDDPFYIIQAHQARILGVTTIDKQNLLGSAVNEPNNFTIGEQLPGEAYGLTESDMPAIGEPIRSIFPATRTSVLLFCARSIYINTGDPALGGFEVTPVAKGIGGSGLNAACLTPNGQVICHTTDGLAKIAGGELVPISTPVLTDFIQVEQPLDNFYISVVRDAARRGCLIFLTPKSSGPAVHFWYDERTGKYEAGTGGFWPENYPDNIGPTAVCDWDGTIVLGGRDGYLRTYDNNQANFDGVAIAWRLPVTLVAPSDLDHDTIIQECTIVRGDGSGEFNVVFYGGRTAEEAITSDDRTLLIRKQTRGRVTILMPSVRAPAIVVEFSALTYNVVGVLEAVQLVTTPGEVSLFKRSPALSSAFGRSSQRGSRQNIGGQSGPNGGSGPTGQSPGGSAHPTGTYSDPQSPVNPYPGDPNGPGNPTGTGTGTSDTDEPEEAAVFDAGPP